MRKSILTALLVLALAPVAPAAAATTQTIGSNLSNDPTQNICLGGVACTYFQTSAGTPTAVVPFDGTITTWRLKAGSVGGQVSLRVLRPSGTQFTGVGTSAPMTVSTIGVNTFSTSLTVKAGDVIGLDNASSGIYFAQPGPPARVRYFNPALGATATGTPNNQQDNYELLLNADVVQSTSGGGGGGTPPPTAPVLSNLSLNPGTFRAAANRIRTRIHKRIPRGTTISYDDSAQATATLRILRLLHAPMQRCRDGSAGYISLPSRRHRQCFQVKPAVTLRHSDTPGRNSVRFKGRRGNRRLPAGDYYLVAFAKNQAGTSNVIRTRFTIVR